MLSEEDIRVLKNTSKFLEFIKPALVGMSISGITKESGESKSGDAVIWATAMADLLDEIVEKNV